MNLAFCSISFFQLLLHFGAVSVLADYSSYDKSYGSNNYGYSSYGSGSSSSSSASSTFTIKSVSCKYNSAKLSWKSCGWGDYPCSLDDDETKLTLTGTYEVSSSSRKLPTQDVTVCGKLRAYQGSVFYTGECRRVDDLCEDYIQGCDQKFKYEYDYDEKAVVKVYYDSDWLIPEGGEYSFALKDLEIPDDHYSLYRYGFTVEFVMSMYYDYSGKNDRRDEEEPWRYQDLVEECTITVLTSSPQRKQDSSDDDDDDDDGYAGTYYSVAAGVLAMGSAAAAWLTSKKKQGVALLDAEDAKDDGSVARTEIEIPAGPPSNLNNSSRSGGNI